MNQFITVSLLVSMLFGSSICWINSDDGSFESMLTNHLPTAAPPTPSTPAPGPPQLQVKIYFPRHLEIYFNENIAEKGNK